MSRSNHSDGPPSRVTGVVARMPWDNEARSMRRLPKVIREWLLYEAFADINTRSIEKLVRQVGADEALKRIKAKAADAARETYGETHPQAAPRSPAT